jgi:hypothetical protein
MDTAILDALPNEEAAGDQRGAQRDEDFVAFRESRERPREV